jgi:uncharacterized protein YecT (DUF1311 family)
MKKLSALLCLVAVLFIYTSQLWAQPQSRCPDSATNNKKEDVALSNAFERCTEETGSFVSYMECVQQEYERQDARLNAAYKKLMASLEASQQSKLRDAQRAWVKFRDAYGDFLGGLSLSNAGMAFANSWDMRATADRAKQLEDALELQ